MSLSLSHALGSLAPVDIAARALFAFVFYYISYAIYAIYLHPLSCYPGPTLAAISPLAQIIYEIRGKQHSWAKELHDKYGEVVRIGPNSLVYRTPQAWKDIYGHRSGGQKPFSKDPQLYTPTPNGTGGIITANEVDHSRMRRLMSHAFSERALRAQEPLIHQYVDLMVQKLHDQVVEGNSIETDVVRWYNFITFDLIADLAFGEPFHCLRDLNYHWWVSLMLDAVKVSVYLKIPHFYPFLKPLGKMLIPKRLAERKNAVFQLIVELVSRRLQRQTERPDFTSYILKHNGDDKLGLSRDEIDANAATFVLAGSETTAAMLAGCTYYLLQSPSIHKRLVDEIRVNFQDALDIQLSSITKLPYLNAVITESMRIYPPVPANLPRLVPAGGAIINGQYVPEGTSVSISMYSTFRSSTNFTDADSFIPERWLKPLDGGVTDRKFEMDRKEALQPFSTGPRNCIGQHLAYAEMHLILTKLLWHFDMESLPEGTEWLDHRSYSLWDRPPLKVKLSLAANVRDPE